MRKEQKGIRIIHKNNQQKQRGHTKTAHPPLIFMLITHKLRKQKNTSLAYGIKFCIHSRILAERMTANHHSAKEINCLPYLRQCREVRW